MRKRIISIIKQIYFLTLTNCFPSNGPFDKYLYITFLQIYSMDELNIYFQNFTKTFNIRYKNTQSNKKYLGFSSWLYEVLGFTTLLCWDGSSSILLRLTPSPMVHVPRMTGLRENLHPPTRHQIWNQVWSQTPPIIVIGTFNWKC